MSAFFDDDDEGAYYGEGDSYFSDSDSEGVYLGGALVTMNLWTAIRVSRIWTLTT